MILTPRPRTTGARRRASEPARWHGSDGAYGDASRPSSALVPRDARLTSAVSTSTIQKAVAAVDDGLRAGPSIGGSASAEHAVSSQDVAEGVRGRLGGVVASRRDNPAVTWRLNGRTVGAGIEGSQAVRIGIDAAPVALALAGIEVRVARG